MASKPARVRLVNLSSSSGRNGSAVALGTSMARSRRHCRSALVSAAASSYVELLLEDSGRTAELGRPGGSQVAGVDLGGGAPYLQVGDQLGRHRERAAGPPRAALQLRRCGGPGRRAQQQAVIGRSGRVPSRGRRQAGGECPAATATAPRR